MQSLFIHTIKNGKRIRPRSYSGFVDLWIFFSYKNVISHLILLQNIFSIKLIPYNCEAGVL